VNDALGVGGFNPTHGRQEERDGLLDTEEIPPGQVGAERFTIEELHHQARPALVVDDVEHVDDVGMVHAGRGLDLAPEQLGRARGRGEGRENDLQGDPLACALVDA